MLSITCAHCGIRLYSWPAARCPRCELDPHTNPPDDDALEDELPEDDDPTDEWEIGTGADDGHTNVTEGE